MIYYCGVTASRLQQPVSPRYSLPCRSVSVFKLPKIFSSSSEPEGGQTDRQAGHGNLNHRLLLQDLAANETKKKRQEFTKKKEKKKHWSCNGPKVNVK